MTSQTPARPAFTPAVVYKDQRTALHWLRDAFGFDVSSMLTDSDDNIVHAEMTHADGVIMVSNEWADWTRSPASLSGANTQRVFVRLDRDIDAHCARARQAGAKIIMEPSDQFYGDRTYMAEDFEGHHWTFAQAVRDVSLKEMEDATGFKFKELK